MAAGQPVPPAKVADGVAIRSRVDLLWQQFANLTPMTDPATFPALRDAVAVAQREYLTGFRTLTDRMVQAGAVAPGGNYPITSDAYVETTTAQMGTLLDVMHAAGRASEARTDELMAQRRAEIMRDLALLGLSLLMAVGLGWVVLRRVTQPLEQLAAATTRLARGELGAAVPAVGGGAQGDEIGRLAGAIAVLREGVLERERLHEQQHTERQAAEDAKRAALNEMAERVEADAREAVEQIRARMAASARMPAASPPPPSWWRAMPKAPRPRPSRRWRTPRRWPPRPRSCRPACGRSPRG